MDKINHIPVITLFFCIFYLKCLLCFFLLFLWFFLVFFALLDVSYSSSRQTTFSTVGISMLFFIFFICRSLVNTASNNISKVYNRNTRTRYEISSKLAVKVLERCQWCRSGVFIVNFEYILHLVLVFLLFTLSR